VVSRVYSVTDGRGIWALTGAGAPGRGVRSGPGRADGCFFRLRCCFFFGMQLFLVLPAQRPPDGLVQRLGGISQ